MSKILLVEDDKSLREIYGVRLLAEGYDIVSAGDGEEALAVAIREKPDLIISDVMMPKISGFEMLDLLRSNDATKSMKVIMMTALSSDAQRERGEKLGADRYLVKSQVGIEDVVRTVHEIMGDKPPVAAEPTQAPTAPSVSPVPTTTDLSSSATATDSPQSAVSATVPTPDPVSVPNPGPAIVQSNPTPQQMVTPLAAPLPGVSNPSSSTAQSTTEEPALPPIAPPADPPTPTANDAMPTVAPVDDQAKATTPADNVPSYQPRDKTVAEEEAEEDATIGNSSYNPAVDLTQSQSSSSSHARIIQPVSDGITPKIDINNLLAQEDAKDMGLNPTNIAATNPEPATVAEALGKTDQLDETNVHSQLTDANAQIQSDVPSMGDNKTIVFPSQQ